MKLFKNPLFILGFLVLAFLFYWFQVRPTVIRSACAKKVTDNLKTSNKTQEVADWQREYNLVYESCLHSKGL